MTDKPLFDETEQIKLRLQSSADRGWTSLAEFLKNMEPADRSLFYMIVQPSQIADKKILETLTDSPSMIAALRSFARQAVIETLKRHFEGESTIDVTEYINLDI